MAAALLLLLLLAGDPPRDDTELAEPPKNVEQLQKTRQTVIQLFQKDFDAATSPAKKQALARQLLDNAPRIKDDVPLRYAMLTEAKDQALVAGQIKLAFEAIDLTAKYFRVETFALKIAALEQLSKTARDAAVQRDLAAAALALSKKVLEDNRFDDAQRLGTVALVSARKSHSMQLFRQAQETLLEINKAKKKNKP